MANIWTVYKRELRNYFNSPIAYIFMILFLIFMSFVFFFFLHFFAAGDTSMRPYFVAMPWFFTFFAASIRRRGLSMPSMYRAMTRVLGSLAR